MSRYVFRNQFALFRREKGMVLFYLFTVIIVGVIVPIFARGAGTSLTVAAFLTAAYLKLMLSDSMVGEREHRTLETLLSSQISGKSVIFGKLLFLLLFAVCFFGISALCAVLTSEIAGYLDMAAWQWLSVAILSVLNFAAISIAGVYTSAKSEDMRVAGSRVSFVAYIPGLMFSVFAAVAASAAFIVTIICGAFLAVVYICIIVVYAVKIGLTRQYGYFENVKVKNRGKRCESHTSLAAPKSQFDIVFRFELKYLLTLKWLLLNFGVLCFTPAIIAILVAYYTKKFDFDYAVFITILMIPRVPVNLIAYSIGGEKVYKTGESLLSTPLRIRSIFLAKCAVSMLISLIMLVVSSAFTLMSADITARILPEAVSAHVYSAAQLMLLFGVGITSSAFMIFISAILSAIMKTPRHGLYVTSFMSFLFVIPALLIVYFSGNILVWSSVYAATLLVSSLICVAKISDKITRPQVMSRL